MKALLSLSLGLGLLSSVALAQSKSTNKLVELVNKIELEGREQEQFLRDRENFFKLKKNEANAKFKALQAELKKWEQKNEVLGQQFETNEKELQVLEEKLNIAKGSFGEIFGVVKQVASDLKGQVMHSLVSSHISNRGEFLNKMAESKELPAAADLEQLWFELLREMTESSRVVKFQAPVVQTDGTKVNQEMIRIGSFNLVSGNQYLQYEGETGQILTLARQPESHFLSKIDNFTNTNSGLAVVGIDPTRGQLLSRLIQAPNLLERVQQGGVVGYAIIGLLVLGILLVIERAVNLGKINRSMQAQLKNAEIDEKNPLGKLMAIFEKFKDQDTETIELKMEEALLGIVPKIEKGISTIKIMAAVAPLMGLLGTVTGMIGTFQSITLFGTGDPKLMAGGISQALVTTVLGLICAIPLLLMHNMMSGRSKRLIQVLQEQAAGLMAFRWEESKKLEK
jgi:biopolymer transport protein ExbB